MRHLRETILVMTLTTALFLFSIGVIAISATWIGLHWCCGQMVDAWQAMKGREWKWPEGRNGVYGPGEEPTKKGDL